VSLLDWGIVLIVVAVVFVLIAGVAEWWSER
jgi:nitrogen fixation-related uncharacterized protein